MSTLTLNSRILAYEDTVQTNNPYRRSVDWKRDYQGLPVYNPKSESFQVSGLTSYEVFSGERTTGIDLSTEVDLTALSDGATYRMRWTETGTSPGFRTARDVSGMVDAEGLDAVLTLLSGNVVTVTSEGGSVFGDVEIGDVVYIPGQSTGDTSLFDTLNEGEWTVLAASATQLTLTRPSGVDFTGATETVEITDADQFQVFSAAGVQVGDTLDLTSDGPAAVVYSNVFSSWTTFSGSQTLVIAVNDTPATLYQFLDSDFVSAGTGYTTVGKNSLAAWAAVINIRIPGLTATVVDDRLVLTSNLSSDADSRIAISDGSLISTPNLFEVGDVSGRPTSGYYPSALRSYTIAGVTAQQIDFTSTVRLADQTITPGPLSTRIYSNTKNFFAVESDQEVILQINGDTTDNNRLTPLAPGNSAMVGITWKTGPIFSLTIKNRTASQANVTVITAE